MGRSSTSAGLADHVGWDQHKLGPSQSWVRAPMFLLKKNTCNAFVNLSTYMYMQELKYASVCSCIVSKYCFVDDNEWFKNCRSWQHRPTIAHSISTRIPEIPPFWRRCPLLFSLLKSRNYTGTGIFTFTDSFYCHLLTYRETCNKGQRVLIISDMRVSIGEGCLWEVGLLFHSPWPHPGPLYMAQVSQNSTPWTSTNIPLFTTFVRWRVMSEIFAHVVSRRMYLPITTFKC